jgi:hypothetical protein
MALFLYAVCVVASGCGDDDAAPSTTRGSSARDAAGDDDAGGTPLRVLVGKVSASDIAVAAVVADRHARLFFCGGPNSYASATHWFQVSLNDHSFDQSAPDGARVDGQVTSSKVTGGIVQDGEQTQLFNTYLIRDGTLAGLYEASAPCGKVGLIVTQPSPKDPARGQGACVGDGHLPQQVNPILPISLEHDGTIAVEVATEQGTQRVHVHVADGPSGG